MSQGEGRPEGLIPGVGLCSVCANARVVANRRGSAFFLCGLSRTDERYPRYPRLPVVRCAGFEPGQPTPPERKSSTT